MTIRIFLFFLLLTAFEATGQYKYPKHEFRAVWVATVNNIDWPSKPGLSMEEMKNEATGILKNITRLGLNAVILQVRPASDAMYHSELEPWSKYLTGVPGLAPEKGFDPLAFWIDECHNRGLELHAWLNPFRLNQNYLDPIAGNHIAFRHPEWVVKYGNALFFDPGLPQVWDHLSNIVGDIVKRYDIDAIHFDDYFYPYPLEEDFPDDGSFSRYNRGFSTREKGDWRRSNVDSVICRLNSVIKRTKPWVKFGISPFGVWRNKSEHPDGSDTRGGTSNYDHLYADVLKWMRNGWIDYMLPQLYWQVGHPAVDFETLANWWNANSNGRQVYIGHAVYKSDQESLVKEWTQPGELPNQVKLIRKIGLGGSAYFSSKHFSRELMGFQDSLKNQLYARPALIPPMKWIDRLPPAQITHVKKSGKMVKWKTEKAQNEMDDPKYFVVYVNEAGIPFDPNNGGFILSVQKENECTFRSNNKTKKEYEFRVSALDRLYNESEPSKPLILKL